MQLGVQPFSATLWCWLVCLKGIPGKDRPVPNVKQKPFPQWIFGGFGQDRFALKSQVLCPISQEIDEAQ